MAATKSSGIAWIGEIPSEWEVKKVKYLSILKGRIGWQGLTSDEYTDEGAYLITGTDFNNGGIDWDSCVYVSMKRWEEAKDIQIKNGDLLITKDGTVGKVAIVEGLNVPCSLNSGILRISTHEGYDRRFLFWVLQSEVFWTWFSNKNSGNSTILHLYQGDFAEFKYAIPPFPEQHAIAAFLDAHCNHIDGIVADLEQQVEILRQYKKALITETVTKGLDKSVLMKNSEIDWIGDMPSHWEMKRLKYCLEEQLQYGANESGDIFEEGLPRYIRITDIDSDNNLKEDSKLSLSCNIAKPYLLQDGDVLFARSGATVGKSFYYDEKYGISAFAGYLIKARVNRRIILPRYLYYVTLGSGYEIWKNQVFSQATIQNIGADKYALLLMTIPPLAEQDGIIDYLDSKCTEIDTLIAEKQQSAEIMRQYKRSLIYEYVTGKKRVEN